MDPHFYTDAKQWALQRAEGWLMMWVGAGRQPPMRLLWRVNLPRPLLSRGRRRAFERVIRQAQFGHPANDDQATVFYPQGHHRWHGSAPVPAF